jgi:hypothetical protein
MMHPIFDTNTRIGTAGGTLLTIFMKIKSEDLVKTAVLAGIGAAVSFIITILLKLIVKKIRKYLL